MTEPLATPEEFAPDDRGVARSATGLLADLNRPDLLTAPDIAVARRLGRLGGCEDDRVLAAVALVVRAVRQGSVCLDLGRIVGAIEGEVSPAVVEQWRSDLLAASLVRSAGEARVTPLVLDGDLVYLDRYWSEEGRVVEDLRERLAGAPEPAAELQRSLAAYFPQTAIGDDYADQRAAVEVAATSWLTVITGGPGTGKTTTVARLLGVLLDGDPSLRIALAAPTGRAAARLGESVAASSEHATFPATHRNRIRDLDSVTLHRLLGWQPARRTFRHGRANRLPYDVVVVDETSMVSLTMMARLLEAVRPQARLVLVGDADQLASVDAGAVLGDLVRGLGTDSPQVRVLDRSRRFGARIGALAESIKAADGDETLRLLTTPGESDRDLVELIGIEEIEPLVLSHATRLRALAESGDEAATLRALDEHRLLCAHREGPYGAGWWNRLVERRLAESLRRPGGMASWYIGRPVVVTANDYGLKLYNGDLGVILPDPGQGGHHGLAAAFADGAGGAREPMATARLPEVRSAHAMTVHRSQGSQVREVTVLLPEEQSALLTRELLYTAVTRATDRVRVVGSEAAVRAAVGNPAQRASGLADRLRPAGATLP